MIGNDVMFELTDKWYQDLCNSGANDPSDQMAVVSVIIIRILQSTGDLRTALEELATFHGYAALSLQRRMGRRAG
jgi:uncharacterized protein YceH (UPF0502 family)